MSLPTVTPDYSGAGFVNLVASIAQACGAPARHPTLALLAPDELRTARNLVFVIVDGLGDNWLRAHGAGSELERRRRGAISSVFPSTTASAITTSYTGYTPFEHGLTGWYGYFGAAGCVAATLPFLSRGDERPLALRGVRPAQVYSAPPLVDLLAVPSFVVSHRSIIDSEYNRYHCGNARRFAYDTLAELVTQTEAAVKSGPGRKYVYTYWPDYDRLSHRHGVASRETASAFASFDAAFGRLLARLAGSDTMVVVTADHGFIDSPPGDLLLLEDAPGLSAMLRFPLCGERRIAYCHVQPGRTAEFIARARDWLGDRAEVRASRELVDEGWFGGGTPHPRFAERIGDVSLVMRERHTIKDWLPGESRHLHIGNHGGTSMDEMRIPLIVART
ncbi:MAG: alkaline phosphatase family protein [Betaproteobacteria bacterium]|nr:alkaline phosphatase family protein [Betaproteobacteria bacterium]